MSSEVELNLRLDQECRTSFDPSSIKNVSVSSWNSSSNDQIDYSSKTTLTSLADESKVGISSASGVNISCEEKQDLIDELLYDCEISDSALLPRTFWMPCTGMEPRCALEKCAMEIFNHHVNQAGPVAYDESVSGAEWWVQIRPSPPAGRYNMLIQNEKKGNEHTKSKHTVNEDKISNEDETIEESGICFHWDKDEDLRLLMEGKMYIHPHIATVTYLSNIGAPTMTLNYRVNSLTGELIDPTNEESVEGYISWPHQGKHLSFDGRYLHSAPSDFMEKGSFKKQIEMSSLEIVKLSNRNDPNIKQELKKIQRRYRRVTLLVNVWLNYRPFNVNIFPESMICKLSKADPQKISHILFKNDDGNKSNENNRCRVEEHLYKHNTSSSTDDEEKYQSFEWSMGSDSDDNDSIAMTVPIKLIQNEMNNGGNIKVSWIHNNAQSFEKTDYGIKITKSN